VQYAGARLCSILRKTDGTTIYATRDLAALFYRKQTYDFDRALYVVGGEQKLHFRQLVETLRKMGESWADRVEHIDFGLVLFKDDDSGRWVKGKSRAGNIVFLDEVLDEAVANIRAKIAEKNPGLENPDAVAETLGVSAIIFNDLKNSRAKDVKFDWDEMLSFEGETGPYVQYAGARLCSILRKAEVELGDLDQSHVDWNQLADADRVLLAMHEFGSTVARAAEKNEPYLVTNLMIRIAGEIHSYLRDHHVLRAEQPTRTARLVLVGAARKALEAGLSLLGVAAPQAM
jgi:arginyl-tRNA synthetase